MFKSLVPWKKRSDEVAVRRNEPTRWEGDEWYPMARIRDELDMLMNRMFDDRTMGGIPSLWNRLPMESRWDLGWEDRGNEYVFQAELPGFEPEDFDVRVSGNTLTIRAEHKDEQNSKNGSSYRYGSFTRTMTLPHGAETDNVNARYHSGVLEVHLPKSKSTQSRKIEVRSS